MRAHNINDTVTMLISECNATPSAAVRVAQRSEYRRHGRDVVDAQGRLVFSVDRGDLSPHETDVMTALIVKLLNEHNRHTEGK
jgi:hypothetical protein